MQVLVREHGRPMIFEAPCYSVTKHVPRSAQFIQRKTATITPQVLPHPLHLKLKLTLQTVDQLANVFEKCGE